jgi:hypothetical protein
MTQDERLLDYLRRHPEGVTSMDVMRNLLIVNVTGRVSDLRSAGHIIVCAREGRRFVFRLDEGQQALSFGS